MRLSGSMLFCLCYVRLVRPVFIPRCECCVTVLYNAVSLYSTVTQHCTVQWHSTVQYSDTALYNTVTQHCTVQWHSTVLYSDTALYSTVTQHSHGGWTQAEPDGHNINKTACYQIISCTVCLSNFIPTLIYAPWGWSHRGIETCRRYFKSILNPF